MPTDSAMITHTSTRATNRPWAAARPDLRACGPGGAAGAQEPARRERALSPSLVGSGPQQQRDTVTAAAAAPLLRGLYAGYTRWWLLRAWARM